MISLLLSAATFSQAQHVFSKFPCEICFTLQFQSSFLSCCGVKAMSYCSGSRLPESFSVKGSQSQIAANERREKRLNSISPNCRRKWAGILHGGPIKRPKGKKKLKTFKNAAERRRLVRLAQTYISNKSSLLKPRTWGTKAKGGFKKRKDASWVDIQRYLWRKHEIYVSPRTLRRDMNRKSPKLRPKSKIAKN